MKQYVSKFAKCPFYRKETKMMVYCEGFLDGSHLALGFDDSEDARLHKQGYCYRIKTYGQCPIAEMLTSEYEKS